MALFKEQARLSPKQLSDRCRELGISQKFIEESVDGMYQGIISIWKNDETKQIPSQLWPKIISVLQGVEMIRNGMEVTPVAAEDGIDEDILDALEIVKENCEYIDNRIVRSSTISLVEQIQEDFISNSKAGC